jgi:hypothetical protein
MCAAILSTSGKEFAPEAFLAESPLRGHAESWKAGGRKKKNGFQIIVCDEEDLKTQIDGVVRFIRKFLPELKRHREYPGVEDLDFRIAYFWKEGVAALSYTLPEELHAELARARGTLTFCVYPCSKEEGDPVGTDNDGAVPRRV